MSRYCCIHGHFYQPPRWDPWSGRVPMQPSASPARDWNRRISRECYEPNTASRLLDGSGAVERRVNNFAWISFDAGPTLLRWLESAEPRVYARILDADRRSHERWGSGNAVAQAYSHSILPLASERDRETEIVWGVCDFERRFGRRPEGMWLPETAVDTGTLSRLAANEIRFTILAPGQAEGGSVDTTRAHEVVLPDNRSISVFFYDGALAGEVAFGNLLQDGSSFARRIAEAAPDGLTHLATDGETFGHHHEFGEMALTAALDHLEGDPGIRLMNYASYLEKEPPIAGTRIVEGSSWSCAHGVERWRSDCGCSTGGDPEWHQRWRAPLRESLDWLRDHVDPLWAESASGLVHDPWGARNGALDLLDGDEAERQQFGTRYARRSLTSQELADLRALMEFQRKRLAMYSSCAWFFNDLAGVETVQALRYAAWLIERAHDLWDVDLESPFLERLATAESNHPEMGTGADVWQRRVRIESGARS